MDAEPPQLPGSLLCASHARTECGVVPLAGTNTLSKGSFTIVTGLPAQELAATAMRRAERAKAAQSFEPSLGLLCSRLFGRAAHGQVEGEPPHFGAGRAWSTTSRKSLPVPWTSPASHTSLLPAQASPRSLGLTNSFQELGKEGQNASRSTLSGVFQMQDQTPGAGTHSESQRRRARGHCRATLPCLHLPGPGGPLPPARVGCAAQRVHSASSHP